jgi:hypothetical protein
MRDLKQLHSGGTFFEGLRWHDGHWWISDFYDEGGKVIQLAEDGTVVDEILIDHPSGLGWLPDGSSASATTASPRCTPTCRSSRSARPTT